MGTIALQPITIDRPDDEEERRRLAAEAEASQILDDYGADESIARLGVPQAEPAPTPQRRGVTGGPVDALPLSPRARDVDARLRAGTLSDADIEAGQRSAPRAPAPPAAEPDVRASALASLQERARMGARDLGDPRRPAPTQVSVAKPEEVARGPIHGIPSEGDMREAEAGDALRRVLHGIGSAFRAYGGMAPTPFRSVADDVRRQQRDGMTRFAAKEGETEETMQAKRAARRADEESAAESADRDSMRDLRERQLAIAESRELRGIEDSEARRGVLAEQATSARSTRERAEEHVRQMTDPTSDLSEAAREDLRLRIQQYRAAGVGTLADQLEQSFTPERLEQMSAADIERATAGLVRPAFRGRAGSHGGNGAGSGARQDLIQRAIEAGIPEEAARLMRPRDLASRLEARTRHGDRDERGEELLPGVYARLLEPGEARSLREGAAAARSQLGALGEIDRITRQYGASGVISPEARAEVLGPLTRLRAMVAQLQNTGIINPSEAPAIEAMLPDPRSLEQMTLGTLQARLRSFRGEVERAATSGIEARGIDAESREALLRYLRGAAGGSEARGSSAGSVRVTAGGRTITVPADDPRLEQWRSDSRFRVEDAP